MIKRLRFALGLFALTNALAYSTLTMATSDSCSSVASNSVVAVSKDGVASVEVQMNGAVSCGVTEHKEVLITGLMIRVGGSSVFVPRSAYADLYSPTNVVIEFRKAVGTIKIRGGDGSDAYIVTLFFDRKKVSRRTLASAIVESEPTEDTRYRLRVLKDE